MEQFLYKNCVLSTLVLSFSSTSTHCMCDIPSYSAALQWCNVCTTPTILLHIIFQGMYSVAQRQLKRFQRIHHQKRDENHYPFQNTSQCAIQRLLNDTHFKETILVTTVVYKFWAVVTLDACISLTCHAFVLFFPLPFTHTPVTTRHINL